ncbi:MAG: peptidase MA domain-containing protein [Dehalococcoidia bacterium]|nr:peptidase MA domain-containing protein [Dehalococcoidia bacterium]
MRTRELILAIVLLVSIVFVPCARSETSTKKETIELSGFTVTLSAPQVNFPDSIEFKIEAEGSAEIVDITLQYQMDKLSVLPVTSVVFPEFDPGQKVSAEWKWDMTQTGGLPPGADLSYWWSIEDAYGREVDTPVRTLSFDDGRHEWREIQSTNFNLYWYKGDSHFAQQLVDAGEEALILLEYDIGAKPEQIIEVYIYGDTEALQGSLIYPQEWTGGVAFTEYGTIALGISARQLGWGEEAMAHEMAHLVVHQVTLNGYGIVLPTWLDEGLAMYAEGELSSDLTSALSSAVERGRLDSVQSLSSSFPADTAGATLAYAESYSLVDYLLDHKGGRENMLELLGAIRDGSGYEEALQEVYGLSISQLDSQWKQYLTAGGA